MRSQRRFCPRSSFVQALVLVSVAAGCTYTTDDDDADSTETLAPLGATTTVPAARPAGTGPADPNRTVVLRPSRAAAQVVTGRDAAALALAASRALIKSAPAVIVTAAQPVETQTVATAEALGLPLLVATASNTVAVVDEITRLGAPAVLGIGRLPRPLTAAVRATGVAITSDPGQLPRITRATPATAGVALVSRRDATVRAATVTARAAGLRTVAVDGGDPRATTESRRALRRLAPQRIVAIGAPGAFPAADVVAGLARTAANGVELPGGGQLMFPGRRLVALYGHPGDANLGVLGEQGVDAAVQRAQRVAAPYRRVSAETVIPTFEVITTVASSEAGPDRDFSLESTIDHIRPWVDAAAAAGFYVVLDLQPGYTDFLTQAKRYAELLAEPHVGLALDPEWRLAPGERHLEDIGSVDAAEVNRVADWLAGLTRRHALPQKLLMVHQFRLDMITHRSRIRTHPELTLVFQMDGLGPQHVKLETWRTITADRPPDVHFGWKNFYDEDRPLRSPGDTVALRPPPVFISYQ